MDKDPHKRLLAAQKLLVEPTTSREKLTAIRTLIAGINPKLDGALSEFEKHLSTWDKLEDGDVIMLSAENLPENTEEEKKRKKWLLLLITSWRKLGSEVERVSAELATQPQSGAGQASMWGRILKGAKGPLGVITVIAVGVAVMSQTSVAITIQNKGCETMYPSGVPISIPGLKLPSEPIVSGSSVEAKIPGLTVHVDGTQKGTLSLAVLSYTLGFQLPSDITNVTMNGTSLLGKKVDVALSERDEHVLVLSCL